MKALTFILAACNLVAGLWAARCWLKASGIQIDLPWDPKRGQSEPVERERANEDVIWAAIEANEKSAKLNSTAAIWTAVAVVIGCLATLSGLYSN